MIDVDALLRLPRRQFPDPDVDVVVYGAGNRGREVCRVLRERGYVVKAFLDRKSGGVVEGVPVLPPVDVAATRGSLLVLGIWRHDLDLGEIRDELVALGHPEPWTLYDLVERWPSAFSELYWLRPSSEVRAHAAALTRFAARLADESSLDTLTQVLRLRVAGDVQALRQPDVPRQYIPAGVVDTSRIHRVIDCGAYTGDTLRMFQDAGVTVDAYAAFEPDMANYEALASRLRNDGQAHAANRPPTEVALFPCGVWSTTTMLTFAAGKDEGSRIDAAGEVHIQAVALDDALPRFDPDLVKIDVEGSEPAVLEGMKKIAARSRPIIAAAAYHLPDHLWSLAERIDGWGLGYRFVLRHHAYTGFDVVLYALPA